MSTNAKLSPQYTKQTEQLAFWINSKKLTKIKGVVVNPQHQTPHGQLIWKPEILLKIMLFWNLNLMQKFRDNKFNPVF